MLKSFLPALLGAVSFCAILQMNAASAQSTTLKIATEGAFEPFNFTDPSGAVKGFDIDVTNAACAKAGLTCEWVRQDWDGLIPGLLAGKFDAVSASMSITDERKKRVAFTAKLYQTALRYVAKTGAFQTADCRHAEGQEHRGAARHHRGQLPAEGRHWAPTSNSTTPRMPCGSTCRPAASMPCWPMRSRPRAAS